MNDLEDEPQDVQDAAPVVDEINAGLEDELLDEPLPDPDDAGADADAEDEAEDEEDEKDQKDGKKPCTGSKLEKQPSCHTCRKPKPAIKRDDCDKKKKCKKRKNAMVMMVHDKPCVFKKKEIIPRKCMTPEEYLNFLATPKERCERCEKIPKVRKFKVLQPRIEELAIPSKRLVVATLQSYGNDLPADKVENLMEKLEDANMMSVEQAEKMIRDRRECKKKKREEKLKKIQERKECCPKEPCKEECTEYDKDAVLCQYQMALKFVKALLNWECCIPRNDYKDISQEIIDRLSKICDYPPVGNEDKKSVQMKCLADVLACWITDLLISVAEKNKQKLLDECLKKRAELDELAALEDLSSIADSEFLDASEFDRTTIATTTDFGRDDDDDEGVDADTQWSSCSDEDYEEDLDTEDVGTGTDGQTRTIATGLDDDGESIMLVEDGPRDSQMQTDVTEMVETGGDADEKELVAVDKLCRSMSHLFMTDVPFVTFARILEILFCMIDHISESTLECQVDNRIHRAIYEKFEEAAELENPDEMNAKINDMLDVISGKIAKWMRKTLQDAEVKFLENHTPEVESAEVRNWSKRITEMTNVAEDWSNWLDKIVCEACKLTQKRTVTRGDWAEWTAKFEANAILFRRSYLEAIHDEHHDLMMITDREVVKTGTKRMWRPGIASELFVKKTSFGSCKDFMDKDGSKTEKPKTMPCKMVSYNADLC